jgi:hypothetical protein
MVKLPDDENAKDSSTEQRWQRFYGGNSGLSWG